MSEPSDTISTFEKIEAIIESPCLLRVVNRLAMHDSADGGRPRHFHPYVLVLVHTLAKSVYGGRVRSTFTELRSAVVWTTIAEMVRRAHPDQPELWLPAAPPKRHHYLHFRDVYLVSQEGLDVGLDELEVDGLDVVRTLGICTPDSGGSWSHPARERAIEADATTIAAISRQEHGKPIVSRDGEIVGHHRGDPDVATHRDGTGTYVVGHKVLIVSTRAERYLGRAILGVDLVGRGGELETLMPILDRIVPQLPGAQTLLYDGAARGVHAERVMRMLGLITIAPVSAERAAARGRDRVESSRPFGRTMMRTVDGYESSRGRPVKWCRSA